MADPINRRLRILQMIPRKGEGEITVSEIERRFTSEFGLQEERRNIERDLLALQGFEKTGFPIDYYEEGKTKKWYWLGKERIGIPKMGRHTALTFHLAKEILSKLLPSESLRHLKPNFDDAEYLLSKKSEAKTKGWLDKIRVVPRHFRPIPAKVSKTVLDRVSQSLFDEKKIGITYHSIASKGDPKKYTISPYALLHRDSIVELVGRIEGDTKIRRFMLHRMEKVTILKSLIDKSFMFDIDQYINKDLAFPLSGDEIQLKAWFSKDAANHVLETRLSDDQVVEERDDGFIVNATVNETVELKWWILGLGDRVKVLSPIGFQEEIRNTIRAMAKNYS